MTGESGKGTTLVSMESLPGRSEDGEDAETVTGHQIEQQGGRCWGAGEST